VPNIHPSPWPSTASFPGRSINVQYNNSKQGCLHTATSNDRFLLDKYFRSYLASKSNIYIYLLLTAAAVVAFGHKTTAMTYVTTNTHIEPNNIQTEHATTQPDDVVHRELVTATFAQRKVYKKRQNRIAPTTKPHLDTQGDLPDSSRHVSTDVGLDPSTRATFFLRRRSRKPLINTSVSATPACSRLLAFPSTRFENESPRRHHPPSQKSVLFRLILPHLRIRPTQRQKLSVSATLLHSPTIQQDYFIRSGNRREAVRNDDGRLVATNLLKIRLNLLLSLRVQ
jgi:hypothetical protein